MFLSNLLKRANRNNRLEVSSSKSTIEIDNHFTKSRTEIEITSRTVCKRLYCPLGSDRSQNRTYSVIGNVSPLELTPLPLSTKIDSLLTRVVSEFLALAMLTLLGLRTQGKRSCSPGLGMFGSPLRRSRRGCM